MIRIGTDFQGWPIKAMSLADILRQLGFKETEEGFSMEKDNPLLSAYPLLLTDDGMGYGVEPRFIVETDLEVYDHDVNTIEMAENKESELGYDEVVKKETVKVFNIFRDVPEHKVEDDE